MKTKEFTNPKEAYEFMNSWTRIKTSYETEFSGKDVTKVIVVSDKYCPVWATVHYKTENHTEYKFVNLLSKGILDKPEKPVLIVEPDRHKILEAISKTV